MLKANLHRTGHAVAVIAMACGLAAALATALPATCHASDGFKLDPVGARTANLAVFYPVPVTLVDEKPAGIKKEPAYVGMPKYGVFNVGNGPRSKHFLALDEPTGGTRKIYIDIKGNGDLTSSGDGAWSRHDETPGREMYGPNSYIVRASYGTSKHESRSSDYGIAFYRSVGSDVIFMYREAALTGTVTVGGKTHKALLVENDADGVFNKTIDDNGKPVTGTSTRAVWLFIDTNDGKWSRSVDARGPFTFDDRNYVASISADGRKVALATTNRKVAVAKQPEQKALLAAGTAAPDFEAQAWGGGSLHLSDYRGKVVILDFWATWCGPCQKSMPHIEKIYQATKDKDIVVLAVSVLDEKAAYEKWVREKMDTYHFKFAYDPAGTADNNIPASKYNVSGIPTTYIIDKDGKVAASIFGYHDSDKRVEEALAKLGINVSSL